MENPEQFGNAGDMGGPALDSQPTSPSYSGAGQEQPKGAAAASPDVRPTGRPWEQPSRGDSSARDAYVARNPNVLMLPDVPRPPEAMYTIPVSHFCHLVLT